MKKYIYKFFKVCIPLLLLVLITVFLIKKVNGGNVFKKIASHETYDTEEDAFDLREKNNGTQIITKALILSVNFQRLSS